MVEGAEHEHADKRSAGHELNELLHGFVLGRRAGAQAPQ